MGLQLRIKPQSSTLGGLLNFDGSVWVEASGSDSSVYEILEGNKKLEFKLYLDTSVFSPTGTFGQGLVDFCVQNSSDYLGISGYNSEMRFYCNENPGGSFPQEGVKLDIDDTFVGKELQFEVVKVRDPITKDGSIMYVKVDGVIQNTPAMFFGLLRGQSKAQIGSFSAEFQEGTIWDVKITNTDTDVLEHHWIGYPGGNTNTAWEDIGNASKLFDLDVSGPGPYTTRDIEGTTGSSNISAFTNKLLVNPDKTVRGVLDFDGAHYVYLDSNPSSSVIDSNGVTYKWNMYIDPATNPTGDIFKFDGASRQLFIEWQTSTILRVDANTAYSPNYDLSSYKGQSLEIELKMTNASGSGGPVDFLKVNGVTVTEDNFSGSGSVSGNGEIGFQLDNCAIWDIEIYNNSNSLEHSWKGYPDGNTNGSWVDDISTLDGSIVGSSPQTRNIQGAGGGGDVFSSTNKLIITPPEVPLPEYSNDYQVITVLDSNNVWIGGSDGSIFKSDTTFGSFEIYDASYFQSDTFPLTDIYFFDSNEGYRISNRIGNSMGVAYTQDGGETWIQTSGAASYNYYDTHIFEDGSVYLVGYSWPAISTTRLQSYTNILNSPFVPKARGVSFTDATTGFIALNDGSIRKSTDGGQNWTTYSIASEALYGIDLYPNSSDGIVVGANGTIYKTDDSSSWISKTSGTSLDLKKVKYKNSSNIYVIGGNGTNSGIILSSSNGGDNWSTLDSYSYSLNDLDILSNTLYVVGDNGNIITKSI